MRLLDPKEMNASFAEDVDIWVASVDCLVPVTAPGGQLPEDRGSEILCAFAAFASVSLFAGIWGDTSP